MASRAEVVALAETYLKPKTPFLHQGRSRHGLDCAGLCIVVGLELGLLTDKDNFNAYGRVPNPGVMREVLAARGNRVRWVDAQPGDVLLLRDVDYRWPCHMAILTKGLHYKHQIIHSYASAKGVIRTELTPEWVAKIIAVFRYPGVTD